MAGKMTSIKVNSYLANEVSKILGVKSRTQAVDAALREIVSLRQFKDLMRRHAGKLSFKGHAE